MGEKRPDQASTTKSADKRKGQKAELHAVVAGRESLEPELSYQEQKAKDARGSFRPYPLTLRHLDDDCFTTQPCCACQDFADMRTEKAPKPSPEAKPRRGEAKQQKQTEPPLPASMRRQNTGGGGGGSSGGGRGGSNGQKAKREDPAPVPKEEPARAPPRDVVDKSIHWNKTELLENARTPARAARGTPGRVTPEREKKGSAFLARNCSPSPRLSSLPTTVLPF